MSNGTAFARPAPPHDPEPGDRWEAAPADAHNWAPAEDGKTCRWRGSGEPHACGQPAVARLMRGIKNRIPWNYCGEHAYSKYGKWVEDVDGTPTVMEWRLADDPDWKPPA